MPETSWIPLGLPRDCDVLVEPTGGRSMISTVSAGTTARRPRPSTEPAPPGGGTSREDPADPLGRGWMVPTIRCWGAGVPLGALLEGCGLARSAGRADDPAVATALEVAAAAVERALGACPAGPDQPSDPLWLAKLPDGSWAVRAASGIRMRSPGPLGSGEGRCSVDVPR